MHYLYILYSEKLDHYYVGESENPEIRLEQHNTHYFRSNFTKVAEDWKIVLSFSCDSRDDALYLERFIKRMKSKKFTKRILTQPEILKDILNKR